MQGQGQGQGQASEGVMNLYSSKESIRKMVWDYLEEHDLAEFPRPVHHRIPNFKGAAEACNRLGSMVIFQKAKTIKVNPDKPQQQARFLALEAHKTLLVPTPRLRTGLFNRITPPPGANKKMLRTCSSSQGVRQYSSPVGLDAEVKVDLVLIGSVAVSPKGYRIGKGEGYADMEFAMMSSMGAVNQDTVVITTVHDCQVKDDLPEYLFGEHDLGVDFIVTPTRTIRCENKRARPKGIAWELLTREKFSKIPVLKTLRRQEAEMGIDVRLKEEREGCLDSSKAVSSKDFCNSKEEGGGSLDSFKAATSKDLYHDNLYHAKACGENPGVHSTELGQRGRDVAGCGSSSTAERRSQGIRKDMMNSKEPESHRSEHITETGRDAMYQGTDMKGQSANSGQRSKGHKPGSGRRRDLAGRVLELSMMATNPLKQAVRKTLKCPLCLSFFKEPKILTCSVNFSNGCHETLLESHRNKDVLLCPTCRGKTSLPGGDVGRLQPNITVRSPVEDVETQDQVQVCSNCNQKDKSLQRKLNKCQKRDDEECFCLNCNKYVCVKCGILECAKNTEELASEADAKIRDVDKYVTFVADRRKWMHNVKEQLKDEIDEAFEESVKKLKARKMVLKNEVDHQLGELETSLGDMEESGRKQIDQLKDVLDSVKNGHSFPIQAEALTSHRAICQQMQELLSRIGPDEELPRKTAEEGGRIVFRCEGSDGLQLGQLRQKELKWVLRTDDPLPVGNIMNGMAISPNNEMAVGCQKGGIFLYSSEGIIQDPVLSSVKVRALHFMPDGGFVIRDIDNRIFLYSELCEKLHVTFGTMADAGDSYGGLTVGKDGLIFVGDNKCKKIHVFKPEGGKAIREITCNGFVPAQIFAMTSSQAIVFKHFGKEVHVIDDVSGACIHSISKVDENPYPAVCQNDSVIIAWVKHDPGLLSIVKYTKKLTYIKNILTDFKIMTPNLAWCHLQEFKTGEIAFCTLDRLYIFHETWK